MDTPKVGNTKKIQKGQTEEVEFPVNRMKPAKASSTPTEKSARAESPESLVGQNYVTSSTNDLFDRGNDLNRATPPSTKKGRPQVSPPRLRPSGDALLDVPIESVAIDSGNAGQPHETKDKGRPPRAPAVDLHSNARPPATLGSGHTRETSAGEVSALSGLTDPTLDDNGIRRLQRQRGVSFGEDVTNPLANSVTGVSTNNPIHRPRPILADGPQRSQRMLSPKQKLSPTQTLPSRVEEKLALADIVSPIESEAESFILQVLENRERHVTQSLPAVILPHLPDEAVDSFEQHSRERELQEKQLRDDAPPRLLGERRASTASIKTKPSLEKQTSKDTLLTDGKNSKGGTDIMKNKKRTDTGEESMENTLYNLANMMRDIQIDGLLSGGTESNHPMPSNSIQHPKVNAAVGSPRTQSDSLANDAALLFRGQKKPVEQPVVPVNVLHGETDPKKNDDVIMQGDDAESQKQPDIELGQVEQEEPGSGGGGNKQCRPSRAKRMLRSTLKAAKEDFNYFDTFLVAKKKTAVTYAKSVFCFLILPATAASAILYYGLTNPSMKVGYSETTEKYPSVSWFILFLCVRQVITFSFAKLTEMFLIDFLALKTRLLLRLLGPLVTLLIVQSKGWPCTITFWAIYDLILLSGDGRFVNHWAFYQDVVGLFNERNPSGNITSNIWNYRILVVAMVVGVVVAIKRFAVGMYLGGKQYSTYGSKLAAVMQKMILISQVAKLGRQLERDASIEHEWRNQPSQEDNWNFPNFGNALLDEGEDDDDSAFSKTQGALDASQPYKNSIRTSERQNLLKLLDQWEEPAEELSVAKVSIKGILQFKQTLAFMDLSYPFSMAFGLADTRENCVQSAEEIYKCLLRGNPKFETLQFETLSAIARSRSTQEMDETRLKELVKVFRPERDGSLDLLGFVRSIDQVYKDLRLLRASIRNSSQIDHAFEAIINVGFYFVIFCVVLASWGIDPLAMFLSFSSVILAFTFAIGSASAKYFEGLLFILGRNPYDIGDRISINSPNEVPLAEGVSTWFVEEVTLYYTTVRLGATNEVATISNSALSNSRIVNAARSKKALVYIKLKFGLDVPYAKIQLFKETVESFVKARPREWLSCSSIRSTRVEADLGFIEYSVNLQHRDSWQQLGNIMESKASVMSFCLEVQKKLGMKYTAPHTPVDLTMTNPKMLSSFLQGESGNIPGSPAPLTSPQQVARDRTQSQEMRQIADMFEVVSK